MDRRTFRCMVSVLNRFDLNEREGRFVFLTQEYFNQNGILTEQQESILRGIYREKTRARMLNGSAQGR